MQKITRILRKGVCSLVSASMMLMPGWAMGGETNMGAIGREAQSFVEGLNTESIAEGMGMNGSSVVLPMQNGGTVSIDQSEFAPQTTGDSRYGYGYSNADVTALRGTYDDGQEMDNKGAAAKKNLYQDSLSDDPSTIEGNVYKVMTKMYYEIERPDMSNDSMFDTTNDIIGNLEDIVQGLGDCSADTVLNEVTNKKHITDYRSCNKVLDRSGTCTLHHRYSAGILEYVDGTSYNIDSCGQGCVDIWLGKVGNNYLPGGACKLYEYELIFRILSPESIIKAQLDYAAYDDQMQVWIGPQGKETRVYQGPRDTFPYDNQGNRVPGVSCELNTHWIWDPTRTGYGCTESSCRYTQDNLKPIDIASYIQAAGKDGLVRFFLRDAIGGEGEAFARMRIYYEPTKTIYEEEWSPPECVEALNAVTDGMAEGESHCTKMPNLDVDGRCTTMDGVIVCPEDMVTPPNSDINPLCQEMELTTDYDFYQGQMDCWIDPQGNKICPDNVGGKLDDCETYEKDPKCTFIKSECVDGAQGASGTCYVTEMTYDCGEDVLVTDTEAETTYECPGDIACMGNECIDTSHSVSNSFAQVTALMNALQYMTQDMECTGQEKDEGTGMHLDSINCTVFGGEPGECKKAVGGMQNCCEPVPGIGLSDYITLIRASADVASAAGDLASMAAPDLAADLAGQWLSLKGEATSVVKEGLSWISDDFASAFDNIGGFTADIFGDSAGDGIMTMLEEKLKSYAKELLTDLFKEMGLPVAEGAGSTTASGAATAIVEGAAMVFAVVSWIYTAYVVANLVIQIVYSCETEEYEMISQKQLGNCHKVGSYCKSKVLGMCVEKREVYCCFQSPLSRIMNEQIRLQGDVLGEKFDGWGEPKNPKCEGIPLDKVGEVDWDRVDLSEWIALLESTGNMPDADSISIEQLTGQGSKLDMDGNRKNTIDRTLERLDGIDVDGVRSEAIDKMELDTGYEGGDVSVP